MYKLYEELVALLEEYKNDQQHIEDNTDLLMGYADDFYDMLSRLKDKIGNFLYE